jgi:acyl-homoserine lactone acylase PvdQ
VRRLDVREDAMADVVAWARAVATDDAGVRRFQERIAGWDPRADASSMPAALAEVLRLELVRAIFAPRLSKETFDDYLWLNAGMQLVALKRIMEDESARFFGPDPAAARAADLVAPWLAGRYRPMSWTRAQVEADAESVLTLHAPVP